MNDVDTSISREVQRNGRAVRLLLAGEFDRSGRTALQRALLSVLTRDRPVGLQIETSAVTAISDECIQVLLSGYARALRGGHGYEILDTGGPAHRALQEAGLCGPTGDDTGDAADRGVPRAHAVASGNRRRPAKPRSRR